MEKEVVFVVEESLEGGYEARALGHSIFSEADDLEGLKKMVHDAVVCHFDPGDRPSMALYLETDAQQPSKEIFG